MPHLTPTLADQLTRFALALIDQQQARVIVPPMQPESGFWFGGGNLVEAEDGTLYLVGRYRNAGDSRIGLAAGERGFELSIFSSSDRGRSFQKVLQLDKADLSRRSEEHTSELQSRRNLVCRLLLEKKKKNQTIATAARTTAES